MDPSGETATTREAEEQDSSSGEESTIQWFPILSKKKVGQGSKEQGGWTK